MTQTSPYLSVEENPVEQWWLAVRKQTSRQMPIESALSFPIPLWQKDSFCLTAFYYGIRRGGDPNASSTLPPIAKVIATYPTYRLLSFSHRQVEEIFPGLPNSGELGSLVPAPLPPQERMNERRKLFECYLPLLSQYQGETALIDSRTNFKDIFYRLISPGLIPYYHALNPQFFSWLEDKPEVKDGI